MGHTRLRANRQDRELLVLVLRDSEGVAGIAPVVMETEKRKGLTVRIMRPLSWFHTIHGTQFILGRNPQLLLNAIFERLNRTNGDWALWFMQFQERDAQECLFSYMLRESGYQFRSQSAERSPYLRIEQSWDEKMKTLQPRFRTALRSREKNLRQRGRIEVRFLDGPDTWQGGLEAIQEIEGDSWKKHAGTAVTVQDNQWHFYCAYAPLAAAKGTLRIPVLFLDGEPLAYDYAIFDRGIYYLLKTSYKTTARDLYPGFVLRKLLVEWAYAQGAREIDFLGKNEDWKMKWTNAVRVHTQFFMFNRTWGGRYLSLFSTLGSLFRSRE